MIIIKKTLFTTLHCLDISTGDIVWQYMPMLWVHIDMTPPLYRDEKIYIRNNNGIISDQNTGYLYCVNTGSEILCVDLNKTPKTSYP